jgi:hypothetical protein
MLICHRNGIEEASRRFVAAWQDKADTDEQVSEVVARRSLSDEGGMTYSSKDPIGHQRLGT